MGTGPREWLFGGASKVSVLIKSSDTASKLNNSVPSNGSNDAGTGHNASAWRMLAILSCIKSENEFGRSARGMLVGNFVPVVRPIRDG